jgi:hypothetical protein
MVTWFRGYALPGEIAERAWRDLRRAIVCGSLEVVVLPLTGMDAARRNSERQGKRAHQNSREANLAPSTRLAILAQTTPESTAAWPTHVPKPQSVPAMTCSRPTSRA